MSASYRKISKLFPAAIRKRLPQEIRVVEISEAKARWLNRKYLGKNYPANVLSFRYELPPSLNPSPQKGRETLRRGREVPIYGEILVCPEIIRREAKNAGNPYRYQMTWMIIHGIIHLAGIHHESSSAAAQRVARLESKILRRLAGKKAQSPNMHKIQTKHKVKNTKYKRICVLRL